MGTRHLKTDVERDGQKLAGEKQTLVFYMGLSQAPHIQQNLLKCGLSAAMPVALVENGTALKQRVVSGILSDLSELAGQVASPSLIIIGHVVALRDKLNWSSHH